MPSGRRYNQGKIALKLLLGLTILVLVCCTAGYLHFRVWTTQSLGLVQPTSMIFRSGGSLASLTRQLQQHGLLERSYEPSYFKILAWRLGIATQLQAGEYELLPTMTPSDLLETISEGRVMTYAVEVAEGITTATLIAQLQADPRLQPLPELNEANQLMTLLDFKLPFIEGAFLPETYQIRRGDAALELLQRAHDALYETLESAWLNRQFESPISTPAELLILASIIEKETGQAADRPVISQVFHLRLSSNMRLQTDPTVIYALGDAFDGDLRRRDLRVDSPFNTYRYSGLPPTPIALPSRRAIEAAAQPSDGNFLYFVARGDGSSYFSHTLAEHNRAVAKYQLGQ